MKPLSKADSTILIACAFALFMALPVHAGDRGYRPFSMGSPTPPPYSIYPSTPPTYAPQPPAIVYSPTPAYLQPPPAVVIVPAPVIEYGPVPYPEYGRHHRLEQRHDGGHRHYPGDR